MAVHLIDESELVLAAKSGDDEAFRVLYNHYYPNIFRVVIRMTRNNEDAYTSCRRPCSKPTAISRSFGEIRSFTPGWCGLP